MSLNMFFKHLIVTLNFLMRINNITKKIIRIFTNNTNKIIIFVEDFCHIFIIIYIESKKPPEAEASGGKFI